MGARPLLMGILNVTPDSFSDGGLHSDPIAAGLRLIAEGADIVDVGGESTRPGAETVPVEEELRRVVPAIRALAAAGITVSIDTRKPAVARAALEAGAKIVNDITGLADSEMRAICADFRCAVCLMHMQGEPRTMQVNPTYTDVVAEVRDYLLEAADAAQAAGIPPEKIWIDPGIGFGKTVAHNLSLLRHLDAFVGTGYPVLVGVSRKGFLGRLARDESPLPVTERLPATLAAQVLAQAHGVAVIRTHDVREACQAARIADAILNA